MGRAGTPGQSVLRKGTSNSQHPTPNNEGMKIVELERDGYHALSWPNRSDLSILDLWEKCPDLVIGKYLVNTSYDSGHLTLSDEERETGWQMIGDTEYYVYVFKKVIGTNVIE